MKFTSTTILNPITPKSPFEKTDSKGIFYIGMALVAIVIAIAGFGPTMVDTESRREPVNLAVAVHGAIFGAWLVLFLAQAILVSKGKISFHRKMGYVGAVLAILMVVSGYLTAINMARRGYDLSGDLIHGVNDPITLLALQLGDIFTFGLLVGIAIWYRKRSDIHKRLMLLATVGALMPAALTHIIGHSPVLREIQAPIIVIPLFLLLFASAIRDRIYLGRIHPISLWVALAMFVWSNLRAVVIGPSEFWHEIANWLIQ
ncbi:hypothetical protein [Aquiflexum sp.]|uniref:hypothetical protein n=1 Tax=Aquiflexum sp. TaxID=1872584 RepID=UPI003593C052